MAQLLREHVDLAVEPPTPRHVASLPSSATELGYIRTAGGGNPAVLSPLSLLAVPLYQAPVERLVGHSGHRESPYLAEASPSDGPFTD